MFSDPGCDNGLIPYETDEAAAVATSALTGMLEQLRVDFATDMLGNGPGEANWGLLNMILSDTMGQPFTAHMRKASNRRRYVDFYVDTPGLFSFTAFGDSDLPESNFAKVKRQRGAFPDKVAGYLQDQMETHFGSATLELNNSKKDDKKFVKSFDDLDLGGLFDDVDLTELPNYGYNVDVNTNYESESITFTRKARKKGCCSTKKSR